MGIDPFLLILKLDRRARAAAGARPEPHHAREVHGPAGSERRLLDSGSARGAPVDLYRPSSDPGTGYRGRTGIYELISVDDHMRTMIHDGSSEQGA